MNNRLKEVLSVLGCILLLAGIGYFTGFFDKYGLSDVQHIFKGASSDLSNIGKGFNLKNAGKFNVDKVQTSRIKGYRANNIPAQVIKGSELSGNWRNIFTADKKVIFYVYDAGNKKEYSIDFHNSILDSYTKSKLSGYYNIEAVDLGYFKNYNVGITGSTKICNSMEECNQIREKSTSRASMQMFLDKCSVGFCIINPKKHEFMFLRNKDSNEAIRMLHSLKNW